MLKETQIEWLMVDSLPNVKSDQILINNFRIDGNKLCGNNLNEKFRIELCKFKQNGKHYTMGTADI